MSFLHGRGHLVIENAASEARRKLKALNRIAAPAGHLLTAAFGMQETQNSAELDGIMTTQQDLYEYSLCPGSEQAEVRAARYGEAMDNGWREVAGGAGLPLDAIIRIRQTIAGSRTKWRKTSNAESPPPKLVPPMMAQLESKMHRQTDADPLVRMAMIHHRLRSIQPFDSDCSSTGRVVNLLFLIKEGLLCAPVLYLSAYFNRTHADYDRLQLGGGGGKEWLLYMLGGITITAKHAAQMAINIIAAHKNLKKRISGNGHYHSNLPTALFVHPYINAPILAKELWVSEEEAGEYLEALTVKGVLQRMRLLGEDIYINLAIMDILLTQPELPIR